MNLLIACAVVGLAGFALAEAPIPSGYNYNRPSLGGGGFPLAGGGGSYSLGTGSVGYTQVIPGGQTSEGASVDGALLEQIRQILLKEESQAASALGGLGGGLVGGYAAPSSSYGVPSSSYGAPSSSYAVPSVGPSRVVGIDLEGIRQAIQVAQFNQVSQGSTGGGYSSGPSGGYPSGPSGGYSALIGRPSSNYGAPF